MQTYNVGNKIIADSVTYEVITADSDNDILVRRTIENVEGWLDTNTFWTNSLFLDRKIRRAQKSNIWIDLEERLLNV